VKYFWLQLLSEALGSKRAGGARTNAIGILNAPEGSWQLESLAAEHVPEEPTCRAISESITTPGGGSEGSSRQPAYPREAKILLSAQKRVAPL